MPASEHTFYNIRRLHQVFAVSALLLLAVTLWLIVADHRRPWKALQRTADRIESRMATWRSIQYLTEDTASEQDRLMRALAELRSQPLPANLLDALAAELREDGARRGVTPPSLARLQHLVDEMNAAAAATAERRRAWQDARLQADKARLELGDATDQVAEAANGDALLARQARVAEARAGARAASDAVQRAAAALAEAESATGHRRAGVLAAWQEFIQQAQFREQQALHRRMERQAALDVAKGRYGIDVRAGQPESRLAAARRECARLEAGLAAATSDYEAAAAHREFLRDSLRQLTADERALQQRLDDMLAELRRLQRVVLDKQSSYFEWHDGWPRLGKKWLELPILDAFNSPRKIGTVWSEGLDLRLGSFGTVRRFDRCTTCHGTMEQTLPGLPDEPAYERETEVRLELRPPPPPPGGGGATSRTPAEQLLEVWGIQLTDAGLRDVHEPTVCRVRPGSPAARAHRVGPAARQLPGSEIVGHLLCTGGVSLGTGGRLAGLLVGDVLVGIQAGSQDERPVAAEQVAERLLALAAASWAAQRAGDEPVVIQVTVRRGLLHPFAGHPRPDLFVGDASPHPMPAFGCTVCHAGQGSATDFRWAAHTPNDPDTRRRWRAQWDWFDDRDWPEPMLPTRFLQSSCTRCHPQMGELAASREYPDAPAGKLVAGHRLAVRLGCFGCHEIWGSDSAGCTVGPDLRLEPPYAAAALQLKHAAGSGYENLTTTEQAWVEQLIAEPERDGVRHQLLQAIADDARLAAAQRPDSVLRAAQDGGEVGAADEAAARPRLSADVHQRLLPLLADQSVPGSQRKVGPALRFVANKLSHDLLYVWVQNPRSIRPTTQMPSYFGLWNHLPATVPSDAEAGPLPPEARFEPIEIFSMVTYLRQRSQSYSWQDPPPGITPVTTDKERQRQVERGRVTFQERGCLACHAHRGFPDMESYRSRDASHRAPDLSDLAGKLGTESDPTGVRWLYSWLKRPTDYHARTIMPDLKLDPVVVRDEAGRAVGLTDPVADLAAYLLAAPPGRQAEGGQAVSTLDADQEQALTELAVMHLRASFREAAAREYVQNGIPASRAAGLQAAERELLVPDDGSAIGTDAERRQRQLAYVARKSFDKYGCCGCHDIPGLEDARPIGIGLNDWGRKDPAQLAFHNILSYVQSSPASPTAEPAADAPAGSPVATGDQREVPEPFYVEQLARQTRIGFAYQKLTEPRSFDYAVTELKGYNERLRMPQFALSVEQREQLLTFVLSLVADPPVERYVSRPAATRQAELAGERVLDKYRCRSCHMTDVERWRITFPADSYGPPADPRTFPFVLARFDDLARDESQAVDRRNLRCATVWGLPAVGDDGQPRVLDEEEFPLESDDDDPYTLDRLLFPVDLYEPTMIDGHPYQVGGVPLLVAGSQVERRDEPHGGDLSRYLLPRVVEREKQVNSGAKGSEAWSWLPPPLFGEGAKTRPDWLHAYLLDPTPIRPAVVMTMPRFNLSSQEATELVNYFAARNGVAYPYETSVRQQAGYLRQADARHAERVRAAGGADTTAAGGGEAGRAEAAATGPGRYLADAMRIVTDESYCVKCHIVGDFQPVSSQRAKAPDLAQAGRRLRADYLRRWLARPTGVLPYTGMQVNFTYDPDAPHLGARISQELYRGDSLEQLEAVVDLLIHFDMYMQQRAPITPLVRPPAPNASGPDADQGP